MPMVFIWARAGRLRHWLKTSPPRRLDHPETPEQVAEREHQKALHEVELRELSKASVFHVNFKEFGDNEIAFAIAVADTSDRELQFYYDRLP